MKTSCYLVFTRRGVVRTVRSTPDLKAGEFAVKLVLDAPDEFFLPEMPTVEVTLTERDAIVPAITVVEQKEVAP